MSEDSKISKAQQKAVHKYVKINYDRIELTVKPKGKKEELKTHAQKMGETLNSFINRAINETMKRDNQKLEESLALEPKNETSHISQTKPERKFKPFTESDADKVDIARLPKDIRYQMDIIEVYGRDVLASLLDKARKENKES